MNSKPDINDLFEAARRRKADQERQQKLSDMIDQLAAAETHQRRRPIWVYSGVAAGILLLVTIGMHILFGDVEGPKDGPIVAETQPVQPVADTDTVPANSQAAVEAAPAYIAPKHSAVIAENTVSPQPVEQSAGIRTEPEPLPVLQIEEPLLAEAAQPVQPDTPQVAAAQRRVFERTSSRLVCGGGCSPKRSQTDAKGLDAPQLAFINNSGTGANFELGSISF